MTYSLTRFAIYETVRDRISSGSQAPLPFYQKVLLGAFGEGLRRLFSGATMASSRGALVTVGQGGCATFLCQPLDVMKTRLMNSKGEYRGVMHCLIETAKLGPMAFYKRELEAKEALATVKQIVETLVAGVRTPERPCSPVDSYITQEEIFQRKNLKSSISMKDERKVKRI
ncbi:UNVERIFIED_CONTAM: hypothetical protein FKN15_054283 [Acipenser sinensis]